MCYAHGEYKVSQKFQTGTFVIRQQHNEVGVVSSYDSSSQRYEIKRPYNSYYNAYDYELQAYSDTHSFHFGDRIICENIGPNPFISGVVTCSLNGVVTIKSDTNGSEHTDDQRVFVHESEWNTAASSTPTTGTPVAAATFQVGHIVEDFNEIYCIEKINPNTFSLISSDNKNHYRTVPINGTKLWLYSDAYKFKVGDQVCIPFHKVKGEISDLMGARIEVDFGMSRAEYLKEQLVLRHDWDLAVSPTASSVTGTPVAFPDRSFVENKKGECGITVAGQPYVGPDYCVRRPDGSAEVWHVSDFHPYKDAHTFLVGQDIVYSDNVHNITMPGEITNFDYHNIGDVRLDFGSHYMVTEKEFIIHQNLWVATTSPKVVIKNTLDGLTDIAGNTRFDVLEKADENCRYCRGTGKVFLFSSYVDCDCVK